MHAATELLDDLVVVDVLSAGCVIMLDVRLVRPGGGGVSGSMGWDDPPRSPIDSPSSTAGNMRDETKETHSRTLRSCSGCKKGMFEPPGVAVSEPGCDGKDMLGRGWLGVKRPGEDTGVLLAVRCGICDGAGGRML